MLVYSDILGYCFKFIFAVVVVVVFLYFQVLSLTSVNDFRISRTLGAFCSKKNFGWNVRKFPIDNTHNDMQS